MIALGWLLVRGRFVSGDALKELNWLTYWVAMPAFLFHSIANARHEVEAAAELLTVSVAATLLSLAAAAAAAPLLGVPRPSRGTFLQGVFRGNMGFIGLPVVMYAFASAGGPGSSAETNALLVFGPMVVLYNLLGVMVLLPGGGRTGYGGALRTAALEWLRNPILLACVAGLIFSLAGLEPPRLVQRSFGVVGQLALPLALLCIGGTLHTSRIRGSLGFAAAASFMKVAMLPAIGLLLAGWVGLSADLTRIALILLACPTASATFVLARQLNGDEALASSIIVVSNLMAVPAMIGVLAVTA